MEKFLGPLKHPAAKHIIKKREAEEARKKIDEQRQERNYRKIEKLNQSFADRLDLTLEEFAEVCNNPNFRAIYSIAWGKEITWVEAEDLFNYQQGDLDDLSIEPIYALGRALNNTRWGIDPAAQKIFNASDRYGKRKRKKPGKEDYEHNPTWQLALQAQSEGKTFTQKAMEMINTEYDDNFDPQIQMFPEE